MISQNLLAELHAIFIEDYKIDLSPEDLSEVGHTLVSFFESLTKIDHLKGVGDKYENSTKITQN